MPGSGESSSGGSDQTVTLAYRRDDIESLLLDGVRALERDGVLRTSRQLFDAAYRAAERECDAAAMARAALGMCGLWVHEHRSVASAMLVRCRLRRALAAVDPQSSLALRLTARLAAEDDYVMGEGDAILAVLEEARRIGDPVAVTEAASLAHHCLLGPDHGELRRALAQDLIAGGFRTSRRSDLLMGMMWYTVDLFLAGHPHAERSLVELRGLLAKRDHLAVGFVLVAIEVMLKIRAGRFDEAEAQAVECLERGRAAGDADATGWYAAQLVAIRWYQGRIAELVPTLREAVNSPTLSAVDNAHLAALAVAAAAAGDDRLAASALARLRGRDLAVLPRSSSWLVTMNAIVEAAYLLSDAESAMAAYELLAPFADLPMMASLGVACFGSVQHTLGVAALTGGDAARAVDHFRAAVRDNLALAHWPAVALSRVRLAQALSLQPGFDHRSEAEQERGIAIREAGRLGVKLPDLDSHGDASPARGGPQAAGTGHVTCHRHGRRWRFELGQRSALVDHCVGMTYLATLLANPGHELSAIELASGSTLSTAAAAAGAGNSDQPVLDEAAASCYRDRLAVLQEELAEHEANNDAGHTARVRVERDWLIRELTSAVGLAGRLRTFAGNEERARISVGKAIRRALIRIEAADPVIADVLRGCLHTGVRCCYRPL